MDTARTHEGKEWCVPDTHHRMGTMVRQSRDGRQISAHWLKDCIDPVRRYVLNILLVIAFLKEQMKSLGAVLLCNLFLSTVMGSEGNLLQIGT